jgi:predicted MFS family arabinose efflux permease
MGFFTAAGSVIFDSIGTLVGVFTLLIIRKPEPVPKPTSADGERDFFAEMREGINVITSNKLLWTQAGCTGTSNLGSGIFNVGISLFALRTLGIPKDVVGLAFSIGAVGFLIGVLISSTVTEKLGVGMSTALAISGSFGILIALLAKRSLGVPIDVLIVGIAFLIAFLGVPIYNINQVSLRQIITPNRLQGRMNATMRTIVWGTIPLGSILGGIFASTIGFGSTIIIGAIVAGSAFLWIVLGPIIKLQKYPEPAGD